MDQKRIEILERQNEIYRLSNSYIRRCWSRDSQVNWGKEARLTEERAEKAGQ